LQAVLSINIGIPIFLAVKVTLNSDDGQCKLLITRAIGFWGDMTLALYEMVSIWWSESL
jgi:hypothetical protein